MYVQHTDFQLECASYLQSVRNRRRRGVKPSVILSQHKLIRRLAHEIRSKYELTYTALSYIAKSIHGINANTNQCKPCRCHKMNLSYIYKFNSTLHNIIWQSAGHTSFMTSYHLRPAALKLIAVSCRVVSLSLRHTVQMVVVAVAAFNCIAGGIEH